MKYFVALLFYVCTFPIFSQNIEIGNAFINLLLKEKNHEKAYNYFGENIKGNFSLELFKQTVGQIENQIGSFKSVLETNSEKSTIYYYSAFEKANLDIKLNINNSGKIIEFFFVPHKSFTKDVSIGKDLNILSGDIEIKGTLLESTNIDLKKLVIFVHGSGPNDRDETVSNNKPFKDIAEKLFSKGISSYRFDKRTYSHPESFNEKSTIDDEVTNDVLNIVKYFKNDNTFKTFEITLIGHSLGAFLGPRIANKANIQVSKIVLLAGNARPLSELIKEQYDYIYRLTPSKELLDEINQTSEKITLLNSKNFNLNTPKENLPLNLPAAYWKSILAYNPIKEVKKATIPILILQGERDYQVTMKDFSIWKKALKNNNKAQFISYPKLNHMFMAGEGPSSPSEYLKKGNVDENVINDIINFIK